MTSRTKKIIIAVIVVVVVAVIGIGALLGLAVIGWKSAIRQGNEAAAIQTLMTIKTVEVQYYSTHNRNFGTFDQLVQDGFDSRFASEVPTVDGYVYLLKVVAKTPSQASSYELNADPISPRSGNKHFFLDSKDGLVRVNADQPAGPNDPAVTQ